MLSQRLIIFGVIPEKECGGTRVDPATLVVQALATGAAAGLRGAASAAVAESYQVLRGALAGRLSDRPHALQHLRLLERQPTASAEHLVHDLVVTGAVDTHLVECARRLLALVEAAGTRAETGSMDLRGAQGLQVGNGNTQHNTFG
jgi:hypothetical protein